MLEITVPVIYVQRFWLMLLPESSQTFVLFSTSLFFFLPFFTLAFYRIVSAQLDSPLMWRLTFPVKEPYCWSFIPLRPPLYKTMVSIASSEHIHSSERERQSGGARWRACQLAAMNIFSFSVVVFSPELLLSLTLSLYLERQHLMVAALPPCKHTNNSSCIYLFSCRDSAADGWVWHSPFPYLLNEWSLFHFPSLSPRHCH